MKRDAAEALVRLASTNIDFNAPESALLSDYGDSLDLVELTVAIEDSIGEVFPKDLSQFKIVKDLIDFVEKYDLK